jgi:hypothetical protein
VLDLISSTLGPDTFSIFEPYHGFYNKAKGVERRQSEAGDNIRLWSHLVLVLVCLVLATATDTLQCFVGVGDVVVTW